MSEIKKKRKEKEKKEREREKKENASDHPRNNIKSLRTMTPTFHYICILNLSFI